MIPSAPAYVLDTDESYFAAVTTSFHPGRVDKGNITLTVLARPVNSTPADFKFVSEESPPWVIPLSSFSWACSHHYLIVQVHDLTYEVRLKEVQRAVRANSLVGWVIRVAIQLYHNFMGETRLGFIETRVIHAQLRLRFSGAKTAVFKPGLPFEGHVRAGLKAFFCLFNSRVILQVHVVYHDDEALPTDKLAKARLTIKAFVKSGNGQPRNLPEIVVPPHEERESTGDFHLWMEHQAEEADYKQFRTSGIHHFRVN